MLLSHDFSPLNTKKPDEAHDLQPRSQAGSEAGGEAEQHFGCWRFSLRATEERTKEKTA